jgi:hypothetical protein
VKNWGPGWEHDRVPSSQYSTVPGLVPVPVPGDQDRIGRKSWKGKGRGWPGLGGRSWEVGGERGEV